MTDNAPLAKTSRDSYLRWCEKRALEYLDRGQFVDALASMMSDLSQHPETCAISTIVEALGVEAAMAQDYWRLRRWITGFR